MPRLELTPTTGLRTDRSASPLQIEPVTRRKRFVGPRGWVICGLFGLMLCTAVMGQVSASYARAEAQGVGHARLAQIERVANAQFGQDRLSNAAHRNTQDWVFAD
jgi:hypothetical protein